MKGAVPFLSALSPGLLWLPPFALLFAVNGLIALRAAPLGRLRLVAAFFALCAPGLCPGTGQFDPPYWGVLTTAVTTFAIISAARLPDLDHVLAVTQRSSFEVFVWMTMPVARFLAHPDKRPGLRRRSARFFFAAALKRGAWEALFLITLYLDGSTLPWPLRSALLMLYFVLNLTATADVATGLCLLMGFEVDEIFNAPLLARSPRDFWSRRWNRFISRFALKHVALPARSWASPTLTVLLVFACSGAFHEYFAWGVGGRDAAFGSMMCFFLIQGLFVLLLAKTRFEQLPAVITHPLTVLWMVITAPLFFYGVKSALSCFEYPSNWLPF